MDTAKRKALAAGGWTVGDAADFLEMSDGERQLLDVRVQMAAAIRQARIVSKLSQKELGQRLNTSQPRIAKIERAAPDVSMDQLIRALVAAGGNVVVKSSSTPVKRATKRVTTPAKQRIVIQTSGAR